MGEAVGGEKISSKCLPILVHKFYSDRWVTSHVVPRKGIDEWAMKASAFDLEASGLQEFIYKSDGESAMVALKGATVRALRERAGDVKMEESGVGESAQNGVVERAIWEVEPMTRTLCHAVQESHGVKLELTHPVRVWAVECSSQLLNLGQRSLKDNRTAYELRRGKPFRWKLPAFAEAVMLLRVADQRRRMKFEDRWFTGIYLGLVERSNMVLIGTPQGVVKVNCMKALPPAQAKDPELVKSTTVASSTRATWRCRSWWPRSRWRRRLSSRDRCSSAAGERDPERAAPGLHQARHRARQVRYGHTAGCPGCDASRANFRPRAHSMLCRQRIEESMEHDEANGHRLDAARAARADGCGFAAAPRSTGGSAARRVGGS